MRPDPRRAVVDRRERAAAEPRPTPLTGVDIAEQAAAVHETADVWRLYRPEWVIVFVQPLAHFANGDSPHRQMREAAEEHFVATYAGRVRDDDWHIDCVGDGPHAQARLGLRLPNLKGEFKYAFLAQRHADEHGYADYTIVARNSKADHELRNYGVLKLPKDTPA